MDTTADVPTNEEAPARGRAIARRLFRRLRDEWVAFLVFLGFMLISSGARTLSQAGQMTAFAAVLWLATMFVTDPEKPVKRPPPDPDALPPPSAEVERLVRVGRAEEAVRRDALQTGAGDEVARARVGALEAALEAEGDHPPASARVLALLRQGDVHDALRVYRDENRLSMAEANRAIQHHLRAREA